MEQGRTQSAMARPNLEYLIAFVNPDGHNFVLDDWLNSDERKNTKYAVRNFYHAIPALRALTTQKYDLIILELTLAPGLPGFSHELGDFDHDPEIERIMRTGGECENPDYWRLGLHVIKKVREQGPNQNTPLFVFSVYNPLSDLKFFEGERIDLLALNAGANKFYSTLVEMPFFVEEVVKQLNPRR